jgi:hypothetical protein
MPQGLFKILTGLVEYNSHIPNLAFYFSQIFEIYKDAIDSSDLCAAVDRLVEELLDYNEKDLVNLLCLIISTHESSMKNLKDNYEFLSWLINCSKILPDTAQKLRLASILIS